MRKSVALSALTLLITIQRPAPVDAQTDNNLTAPTASFAMADVDARPASVPATHINTPGGWYHRACVIEVAEDERIRGDRILRADGTQRSITPCPHPRYDRTGNEVRPAPGTPTNNGWLASATSTAGAMNWLTANFIVPNNPAAIAGQTLYFFPGAQPTVTMDRILQPVLAWNGADAPASAWAIYSWNYIANNAVHSPYASVSSGETISGYLMGTSCNAATGVCDAWQVRTAGTTASSTLDTTAGGEVLNWWAGGVMEVYGVNACNQYPPNSIMSFQNVAATHVDGTQAATNFATTFDSSQIPRCVTGVDTSGTTVNIRWCIPNTVCGTRCGSVSDGCGGTISCPPCCPTCGCPARYICCEPGVNRCLRCYGGKVCP